MTWPIRRFLAVLAISLFAAISTRAYTVALKDGNLIQFQRYRTTESTLLYVDDQGREISIPLSSIDLDRTSQLNAGESSALVLPGMQTQNSSKGPERQPSLGEVARKAAKSPTAGTAKRVFTDDDVAHSEATGAQSDSVPATPQQAATTFDHAEAFANLLANKTVRELGELEVGEIQFPGRDKWEAKLFDQKEKLIKATRTGVDAGRRYVQILSARNPDSHVSSVTQDEQLRIQEAKNALSNQISNIRLERYRFDQVVSDGVRAASEWKRTVDK